MHIIVAGGGVAGLCAALVLARSGHAVTLVERDPVDPSEEWQTALSWARRGIPHFHQPHWFLPRGRLIMREVMSDVYEALLSAGAEELPLGPKAPGGERPEDAELVFLAVRRPLIEWALWRAVLRQPNIVIRSDSRVIGLAASPGPPCRVQGLRTTDGAVIGDLLIDAMGRRSPLPAWLARVAGQGPQTESSNVNRLIYSRYFQIHPGERFPDGSWLLSPNGSLGYMAFITFIGDNNTFAIVLTIPTWDRELRALRNEQAFMAACQAIPVLSALVDPGFARPITPVLPMGSVQNTLRTYMHAGEPIALGVLPVADAYCHTSPAFALGLSMALAHAVAAAQAMDEHTDPCDQVTAYFETTLPETAERFRLARDIEDARTRLSRGEKLDFTRRSGNYPLFALVAGSATAMRDPDVFRRVMRRNGFLDRTAALDADTALLQRIEDMFTEMQTSDASPRQGPPREELLELIAAS